MKPAIVPRLLLLLFCLAGAKSVTADERRPNIIVIFTDDQGYRDLGCFGSATIKTPYLDQMANEGVKLTSFYAQPVCGVSRAALMTGCYPIRVAEPDNIKRLHTVPHADEVTMAEVLKSAGYSTGIVGKWHLALDRKELLSGFAPETMPNAQGFDYFYGTPRFNGFTVRVDDTKVRSPIFRNDEVVEESVESWDYITGDYTREAIDFIREKEAKENPFFLYLAHNMPHIPLGASEKFKGKSAGGFYGDTIEELDWSCGEIFKTLKELGIDDNTLVIFTSDNGPWVETTRGMKPAGKAFIPRDHSGNVEPLRGWKMSAWDGGCRVPFIARWPGKIPAGWSSDELLCTLDLLPTFASIAGAELPEVKLDGFDSTGFLTRQAEASPRDEYLYYSGCLLTGVRDGRWKMVLPRENAPKGLGWWARMIEEVSEIQLYDLDADPSESTNVAASHPEIIALLTKRIEAARVELGDIDQTGAGARFFDTGPRQLQIPIKKSRAKKTSSNYKGVTGDQAQVASKVLDAAAEPAPDQTPNVRDIGKPNPQPNIVIIFTDDQGYGDLSCFGGKHVSTPRIDRMAKEGMKLTSFYVAAPVCTPSRAALMTGCYPKRIDMAMGSNFGVLLAGDRKGLNPDEVTIAEVLKSAGYKTGMFGKWHLGDQPAFLPTKQGFDEFFGLPYSHDIHPFHTNQRKYNFPPLPLLERETVIEVDPDADYLTQRITQRAVDFIEQNKGQPFFLYVPHPIPHRPLHASPPFMENTPDPIKERLRNEQGVDYKTRDKIYKQAVSEIDWSVGQILDALKQSGLDENTIVIFTSDNGPSVGKATPLSGKKGSTLEGGMREPTVVRWPGKIPADSSNDELMTTMDLLPTFAKLAGAVLPTGLVIDGKDIWSTLIGRAPTPHEAFFYHSGNQLQAVRSGDWKLHTNKGKPIRLYDLESDVGEKRNVIESNPEVVERLERLLEAFEKDIAENHRPAAFVENPQPLSK